MGMGCGMSLVKYILFIFNLLCALCGIALLTVGIVVLVQLQDFEKLFEGNVYAIPVVCIIVGSIVFLTAFFGCCGAIRESHCMTITYATILMLLIIIQIVIGALVFAYGDEVKNAVNKIFVELWEERQTNTQFFDSVQSQLKCCGKNGPFDWGITAPMSCCGGSSVIGTCTAAEAFTTGCQAALNDFLQMSRNMIGFVALGIAAVELVGFIFACCLANSIRNERRR